jgi:hypothetical protein
MHMFYTLKEARVIISEWQRKYNERRPHSALGGLPPKVFAARSAGMDGTKRSVVPSIPARVLLHGACAQGTTTTQETLI